MVLLLRVVTLKPKKTNFLVNSPRACLTTVLKKLARHVWEDGTVLFVCINVLETRYYKVEFVEYSTDLY